MNFVYNNNNNSNSNSGRQYMVKSNSTPRSSPNKMERVSFMQQEKNDDSDIYGHQSSIIMDRVRYNPPYLKLYRICNIDIRIIIG